MLQSSHVKLLSIPVNVLLFLLTSCISSYPVRETTIDEHIALSETIDPTPEYIYRLWPAPGSRESVEEYKTLFWYDFDKPSVCVEFEVQVILEAGDFYTSEELLDRFSLKVDGVLISKPDYVLFRDTEGYDGPVNNFTNEPIYHVPAGSPYFICFAIDLAAGKHKATFIADKTSGVQMLYSWEFDLDP